MRVAYASRIPRLLALVLCGCTALAGASAASAYSWPLKPFHRMHAIRGAFDDPRFHLDAEGALSAFHFGVDIAAPDGTRVYAVEPGRVSRHPGYVTVVHRAREFGYWHIRPVVHTGQHVRLHQLLGTIAPGWGHVHLAESVHGRYRNPLRPGGLQPYVDHTPPVVASITLVGADPSAVRGTVDVEAEIYDLPAVAPAPPWQVARLTPAFVWWRLYRGDSPLTEWNEAVDFSLDLMPEGEYGWIYAPGTYQNKANRPGHYEFWIAHDLDTTGLGDGRYRLVVWAEDTRWNAGFGELAFTVANGAAAPLTDVVPDLRSAVRRAE